MATIKILLKSNGAVTDSGISIPEVYIYPSINTANILKTGTIDIDYKCWVSLASKNEGIDVPFKLQKTVDGVQVRVKSISNYAPTVPLSIENYGIVLKNAFVSEFGWVESDVSIVEVEE